MSSFQHPDATSVRANTLALDHISGEGYRVTTHPLWRPFTQNANSARQSQRVASRQTSPGAIRAHDPSWIDDFGMVRTVIEDAMGDGVIALHHVGSTAVAGLYAKPVIDIDLTVEDVEDETRYIPGLENSGFLLIFRDDMAGDPHRHLTFARPNANLHIWSPGAIEPQRHLLFSAWLRANPTDRDRYSAAKIAAAGSSDSGSYNDRKAATVYDIYERAFLADPAHHHEPQPRSGSRRSAPQQQ